MTKKLNLTSPQHRQLFQDLACSDQLRNELLSNPQQTLARYHINLSEGVAIQLPTKQTIAALIKQAGLVFSSTDNEEDFGGGGEFGGGLFNLFIFRYRGAKSATCR